jgi:mannosylglycerate hydrolase
MTLARAGTPDGIPSGPALRAADLSFSIVPHTHWDREWYLPFQQFRMRLARTVDEILDVLEADEAFSHFTLDGQAVILEDYLELRPHQESRLRALVASGRIAIGPSYVLPDEYLAGQEALVRNVLVGRQVCRRIGGQPMPVGYMPDTFGHVAQMPQILRGFGLDTFVFWRGLGDESDELGAVFTWQGPDGSSVTAIRQLGSYGSANELGRWGENGTRHHDDPGSWPSVAAARFERFVRTHGETVRRSGLADALLCNGADHERIQADLPALLAHAREAHPGMAAEISTYAGYVDRIRPRLDGSLRLHLGELCGGRDAPVLRGINSTRMYLKQRYAQVERDLLVAETTATLAWLDGAPYPSEELSFAWREVLRNLPHDSISGCSIDEVHRDMAARFQAADQIAARVRREALASLAGASEAWTYRASSIDRVSVLNPLPWPRTGIIELLLPPELERARSLVAVGSDGSAQPAQLVRRDGERRAVVAVEADGFGAASLELRAGRVEGRQGSAAWLDGDGAVLENEMLRVRVLRDGSLAVLDRRSGNEATGLHVLEDVADRGDEYNFCPLDEDPGWTSAGLPGRLRVLAWGPLLAEVEVSLAARLPAALTFSRTARTRRLVSCQVRTLIRLASGSDRIDFRTTIDNRARDHRLRVRFPAPKARASDGVRAEGQFAILRRAARPSTEARGWAEPPALTHHTSGAVAAGWLTVIGRGLPEYEAVPSLDGGLTLALTLLRCVGWLSRDDLTTRPGHAGPEIPTPDAQCPGVHNFEYAIRIGEPVSDVSLVRESAHYRVGWEVGPDGIPRQPLLRVSTDGLAFSALKRAEDGAGAILRLYAPGQDGGSVGLDPVASSTRCRLDEEPVEGDPLAPLRPGEIRSIRIDRSDPG